MTWARPNVTIEFTAHDIDRLAVSARVPIPLDGHALADAVADMAERLRRIEIMRQALTTAEERTPHRVNSLVKRRQLQSGLAPSDTLCQRAVSLIPAIVRDHYQH